MSTPPPIPPPLPPPDPGPEQRSWISPDELRHAIRRNPLQAVLYGVLLLIVGILGLVLPILVIVAGYGLLAALVYLAITLWPLVLLALGAAVIGLLFWSRGGR